MSAKSRTGVVAPWGAPRKGTTHWMLGRQQGAKWPRCRAYNAQTGTAEGEWPIEVLSVSFIQERWGGGTYRIQWIERGDDGPAKALGKSGDVVFDGMPEKPLYYGAPSVVQDVGPAVSGVTAKGAVASRGSYPANDAADLFERVFGKCEGLFGQVVAAMQLTYQSQLQQQSALHTQQLALVQGSGKDERIVTALVALERKIDNVGRRVALLENEPEELEEPEKPASKQFEDMMLGMLRKAVEKYGEAGVRKIVQKMGFLETDGEEGNDAQDAAAE